jgi:SAM-dependent methyltransferase
VWALNVKKSSLRPKRSLEQLRNHYTVEKELAAKLRNAPRSERPLIYATMYDELFRRVPDHSRLLKREDPVAAQRQIRRLLRLVRPVLTPSTTFLECGAGDCRFAFAVCRHVRHVYAVDIAEQIGTVAAIPDNFTFIKYDGYHLTLPDSSVDVAFSHQLIEHLHPEDTQLHFQLIARILKIGGHYLFTTPHKLSGPADISRYFSDTADGFHLKEWTYQELMRLLQETGYAKWTIYRFLKGRPVRVPNRLAIFLEQAVGTLPRPSGRKISKMLFPTIIMHVTK